MLWEDASGNLLEDSAGNLIDCDTCPCGVRPSTLPCGVCNEAPTTMQVTLLANTTWGAGTCDELNTTFELQQLTATQIAYLLANYPSNFPYGYGISNFNPEVGCIYGIISNELPGGAIYIVGQIEIDGSSFDSIIGLQIAWADGTALYIPFLGNVASGIPADCFSLFNSIGPQSTIVASVIGTVPCNANVGGGLTATVTLIS